MNKHTRISFRHEHKELTISAWMGQATYYGGVVTLPIMLESSSPDYSSQSTEQLHTQVGKLDARTLNSLVQKRTSYITTALPHYLAIAKAMKLHSPREAKRVQERVAALEIYLSEPDEGERAFRQILGERRKTDSTEYADRRRVSRNHAIISFF